VTFRDDWGDFGGSRRRGASAAERRRGIDVASRSVADQQEVDVMAAQNLATSWMGPRTASAVVAAAALVVVAAGPTAQTLKPEAATAAHMKVHFGEALAVHDAVTRGDLAGAKPAAAWLATHEAPASLPPGTSTYVTAMQVAARRAADADTILGAALASAAMLKACGDCHRAVGTMPALPPALRPELGGVVGHMLEHQTAAEQMAQGLIVPSSAQWRAGAEGFKRAPLRPAALPRGARLPDALVASETRIHELADQALRTEDAGARAVFYGQILGRCADCHAQHRTLWGPTGR
jgi:hypothetical protein